MDHALPDSFYSYKTFDKLAYAGQEVHNKIFEECIFNHCDFSGADFFKTRFVDCFFVDCNLSMIKLRNCGLQNISFRECKLLGVNFSESDPFLFAVKFESCVLDYASFMGKKMPGTLFQYTSLKSAVFIKTDLKGAKFEQADLEGALFEETILTGADFTTASHYAIDPENNRIRKARFSLHGLPGLLHKYDLYIE